MPSISVQELHTLLEHPETFAGSVVIDVRQPEEYASGHVPGALLFPLDSLGLRKGELANFQTLYVICRSGGRSSAACGLLSHMGFPRVVNVEGGLLAWAGAGYSVAT